MIDALEQASGKTKLTIYPRPDMIAGPLHMLIQNSTPGFSNTAK